MCQDITSAAWVACWRAKICHASVSTSISANHGHGVIITVDQLSGGMLTLDIQGASTHPHTVELSMGNLQSIAAGTRVSVDSSFYSFHTHNVTFELI